MQNQDRAKRLLELAKQKIKEEEYGLAKELLNRSVDEYDTNEATNLLLRVEALMRSQSKTGTSRSSSSPSPPNMQTPNQQQIPRSSSEVPRNQSSYQQSTSQNTSTSSSYPSSSNSSSTYPDLPSDDEAAAKHIISLTTHYEVLRVTKHTPQQDIKKSYRRLSLRFHPDKCRAPSSEDCFKVITEAHRVLSDDRLKMEYDYTLEVRQRPPQRFTSSSSGGGARQRHFTQHTADITPEDLFNMFFFPNMGDHTARQRRYQQQQQQRHQQQRRQRHEQQQRNEDSLFSSISHIIPFILLLIITFLSFPSSSSTNEISYSFEQSNQHFISRQTHDLRAPYFVNNNFMQHFSTNTSALETFEQSINNEYQKFLMRKCRNDIQYSRKGDISPNCKLFQDFEEKMADKKKTTKK